MYSMVVVDNCTNIKSITVIFFGSGFSTDVKSYLKDTKDMLKTTHNPILDEMKNADSRKR